MIIKLKNNKIAILFSLFSFLFLFVSCTFDYGESGSSEGEHPDLVMVNVEYIRVRSADPIARVEAERVERYERQGLMKLENFAFEQYGEYGQEVNAAGAAGSASFFIESGDFLMSDEVRLEVISEDIVIETFNLEWRDEPRTLASGEENEVNIFQQNGTHFIGVGLFVNARERTWEFSGSAFGTYIFEEEEEASYIDDADISDYISEVE